ncbi:MAG TPA: hypothetical protein P5260_02480 [Candidatus Competibacter sp.]|nr:hypothetical protein [Candidatus Competibacter sp.]HRF62708.1 hypothetical protein [Candidatus Competibacter sp.]HRX60070.1 hypothetical protein [Candidatus Competibacter sp.]HUM92396.1 hypothetical protein [Candidatus Competibacter sp.]
MDRSKVSAPHPYLAPPVAAPSSELLFGRLGAYWQILGVTDPAQIAALSEQALRRAAELPETPGLDPLAQVLLAAGELLDDWLARALDLPRTAQSLAAARAALLCGRLPDWPKTLFAPPGEAESLLDTLQEAIAEPTPAPLPATMPAQRIELFSLLGPLHRLQRGTSGA